MFVYLCLSLALFTRGTRASNAFFLVAFFFHFNYPYDDNMMMCAPLPHESTGGAPFGLKSWKGANSTILHVNHLFAI